MKFDGRDHLSPPEKLSRRETIYTVCIILGTFGTPVILSTLLVLLIILVMS